MLAILMSALTWLIQAVVLRVIIYGVLALICSDFVSFILTKLPSGDGGLGASMAGLDPGTWYFLDMFDVPGGLSLVLAAYVTRFAVRRIPFFN